MENKSCWRPANLSKALILFLLIGSSPIIHAQNLSGLYTGSLTNDSTGRKQQFELALSEYKGKITGYTYTTFIANDTFYYSIKRVEAEREKGYLVVKDVKMENNNFPESPAKKVKQTAYFPLINDSTIDVARGRWETNRTRLYYSIGGKAELEKKEDDKQSSLLAHLSELGIESNLPFDSHRKVNYQEGKEMIAKKENPPAEPDIPLTKIKEPGELKVLPVTAKADQPALKPADEIKTAPPMITAPVVVKESGAAKPAIVSEPAVVNPRVSQGSAPDNPVMAKAAPATPAVIPAEVKQTGMQAEKQAVTNQRKPAQPVSVSPPVAQSISVKPEAPGVAKQTTAPAVKTAVPSNPVSAPVMAKQTSQPPVNKPVENTIPAKTQAEPVVKAQPVSTPAVPVAVKAPETAIQPAALPVVVATRQNTVVQQLTFSSDSLIIALYDNGVVDGDSVSVFVNGSPVLEKAMLKVSATKKTVYTSPYADSIQILLFAENLGTIAPNTGLMTIRDGDQVHQVRFSADLNKNAAITLRRKRKE